MQNAGAVLQAYNTPNSWEPLSVTLVPAPMCAWRNTQKLDLRALLAGNETGLVVSNAILQESGIIQAPVIAREAGIFVVDLLTTVEPTDEVLALMFSYNQEGTMPGFLLSETQTTTALTQTLNPSQVIWGLWRYFVKDQNLIAKAGATASFMMRPAGSGYFGEGETMVAPHVFWTRVVFSVEGTTTATSYPAIIPSANLVLIAAAEDLSTPQEVTAMMRSAGR